jgi:hypothetical protein
MSSQGRDRKEPGMTSISNVTRSARSIENDRGEITAREGELIAHGRTIGHGCGDCVQLRISPGVLHGAGAAYYPVITFTAGHGGDRGGASIDVDDIPAVIAELERLLGEARNSDGFPEGWPVS